VQLVAAAPALPKRRQQVFGYQILEFAVRSPGRHTGQAHVLPCRELSVGPEVFDRGELSRVQPEPCQILPGEFGGAKRDDESMTGLGELWKWEPCFLT